MSTNTPAPIIVNGITVPHPDTLRLHERDMTILVDAATFPIPEWRRQLKEIRFMLLLAETVHAETA